MGFIEKTPGVYVQLAELGVSAQVWDEVIEELRDSLSDYGESYLSNMPPALDEILFDLRPRLPVHDENTDDPRLRRQLDYTRAPEQTDRGYVASLLKQADDRRSAQLTEAVAVRNASGSERRIVDDEEDEDFWEEPETSSTDTRPEVVHVN